MVEAVFAGRNVPRFSQRTRSKANWLRTTPADSSCWPIRAVEEPGASSTNVSISGPNGAKTSQATEPAPKSNTKQTARKIPAAPEFFLFLIDRLRRTIL